MSYAYIVPWLQNEYYKKMFIESGKWIRHLAKFEGPGDIIYNQI